MGTDLEGYSIHAKRYGTEGVMEAAAKRLPFEQLVELQTLCDDLDRAQLRFPPKRRPNAEQKVKKLLGLTEESE